MQWKILNAEIIKGGKDLNRTTSILYDDFVIINWGVRGPRIPMSPEGSNGIIGFP
jgi:hypothetical protein